MQNPERCQCSQGAINKYQARISGPLLDRIDIYMSIPGVKFSDFNELPKGERSQKIKQRVVQTQQIQTDRQLCLNAELQGDKLSEHCQIDKPTTRLLNQAEEKLNLSARGYIKVLKTARTIADLQEKEFITQQHVLEALNYRYVS